MLIQLTQSQLMALTSFVAEHLLCPKHTEEFVDVVNDTTTKPEELLTLLLSPHLTVTAATLKEMERISGLADIAPTPQEYQVRLVALAMVTRQYLRELLGRQPPT